MDGRKMGGGECELCVCPHYGWWGQEWQCSCQCVGDYEPVPAIRSYWDLNAAVAVGVVVHRLD